MSSSSEPALARPIDHRSATAMESEDGKSRTIWEALVMFFEISFGTLTSGTDGHGKVLIRVA